MDFKNLIIKRTLVFVVVLLAVGGLTEIGIQKAYEIWRENIVRVPKFEEAAFVRSLVKKTPEGEKTIFTIPFADFHYRVVENVVVIWPHDNESTLEVYVIDLKTGKSRRILDSTAAKEVFGWGKGFYERSALIISGFLYLSGDYSPLVKLDMTGAEKPKAIKKGDETVLFLTPCWGKYWIVEVPESELWSHTPEPDTPLKSDTINLFSFDPKTDAVHFISKVAVVGCPEEPNILYLIVSIVSEGKVVGYRTLEYDVRAGSTNEIDEKAAWKPLETYYEIPKDMLTLPSGYEFRVEKVKKGK